MKVQERLGTQEPVALRRVRHVLVLLVETAQRGDQFLRLRGVDALLVVPLSAHALFARPLVLGPTSTVVVEVIDGSQTHGVVWCDGRRSIELRTGMEIEVTRGQHRFRLARLSEAPFTDRLVNKFGLRIEGWRGAAEARNRIDL